MHETQQAIQKAYQITIKRFLKKGLIDDTAEQQSIAVINSIVISMIIKHSSASKLDPVIWIQE